MVIIMIQKNDCQTERQGPENVPLSWVQQSFIYQFRKSRVAYSYHSQEDVLPEPAGCMCLHNIFLSNLYPLELRELIFIASSYYVCST